MCSRERSKGNTSTLMIVESGGRSTAKENGGGDTSKSTIYPSKL